MFFWIVVLLLCVIMSTGAEAVDKEKKPILIESDRLETFDNGKLVVFSGNVRADKDLTIIFCDEMRIYYQRSETSNSLNSGSALQSGTIEKIEAQDNVKIRDSNGLITGDNAVLYNEEEKIVITGNAEMKDADNIIKGERITFFLNEGKGIVESSKTKRVKATIYPKENKNPAK
ncbi:MAG: hypothetical protein M0P57_08445 [Syntrophales bacterium]|nr:hypothetical protein [Syntrophales bacterium]MDY0043289.1 LptA/OstA family protein [Syntrophales bacterium]